MALGKPTQEMIMALNEICSSAEPEVVKKNSAAIATVKFRLQKLDKIEAEMGRRSFSGDNMGISQKGRVEDEQASPQAEKPTKKRGGNSKVANKGTCQKVSKAQ